MGSSSYAADNMCASTKIWSMLKGACSNHLPHQELIVSWRCRKAISLASIYRLEVGSSACYEGV